VRGEGRQRCVWRLDRGKWRGNGWEPAE
jgi:hypothetical protein